MKAHLSEIRKDYVTDTWVVISEERAMRPRDFIRTHLKIDTPVCVFCSGNEKQTPPEIFAYRTEGTPPNTSGWWIRTVPNKFPALRIEGELERKMGTVFSSMSGIGCHEVIVESPEHDKPLALLPVVQVKEVLEMYRHRFLDLSKDKRFKYIQIFENHGAEAGASLAHPHSQVIATPMIPVHVASELRGADNFFTDMGGDCIFDSIISEELKEGKRIIFENSSFLCIAPYASKYPYEMLILPRRHMPRYTDLKESEISELADILRRSLNSLYNLLNDPPYNFYIHTAPVNGRDYTFYHWHLEITPRVSRVAGFERGTGFYINTLSPESAAIQLSGRPVEGQQSLVGSQLVTAGTNLRLPELS